MYPLLNNIIPVEVQELAKQLLQEPVLKTGTLAAMPISALSDYLDAPETENARALYALILHSLELNQVPDFFDFSVKDLAKTEENESEWAKVFTHHRARDFFSAYLFFHRPTAQLPLSEECVRKIATQNYCSAMETEIGFRIEAALGKMWENRQEALKRLIHSKDNKVGFHPEFAQFLHQTMDRHPTLAFGGSFEDPIFINTFRYMAQINDSKDFRPSLAEAGLLILGLNRELGLHGLTDIDATELSLRLFRLHKIKTKSFSVHNGFDENLWEIFLADCDRILELVKNLHFAKAEPLQEVA